MKNANGFQTKSGRERAIPMTEDARSILVCLLEEQGGTGTGYVLRGVRGGRLNGNHVSRRFKTYARLARVPEEIHFHSLRHTTASWLVQRGSRCT